MGREKEVGGYSVTRRKIKRGGFKNSLALAQKGGGKKATSTLDDFHEGGGKKKARRVCANRQKETYP